MTYGWCNPKRLDTLSASGSGNSLTFVASNEVCQVELAGDTISKVTYMASVEPPVEILASEVKTIIVGEGNTQRRVTHFLAPGGPAKTMRLGITHHIGEGTWSSLPHDFELVTERGFEEVFFYLVHGGSGTAWQRGRGVWFDGSPVDDMWPVKDKTFGTVPMGYHPVVGEPSVKVSYVWAYLAKHPRWEKVK